MVLSGIVLLDNKNIGIEIFVNKNELEIIRKISNDILSFFNNIYNMTRKKDDVKLISKLFFHDKMVENIIFRKNNIFDNSINVSVDTNNINEYIKIIENIIIITKIFNNGKILLNNSNYEISLENELLIFDKKISFKKHIKIKVEFKSSICLDKYYMKISHKNPLGKIFIFDKFIHQYYCKQFNVAVSDLYMDYELHKNYFENLDSTYKMKLVQLLINQIKDYNKYGLKIKNVTEYNIYKNDICPICYSEDATNLLAIKICKNNHTICESCLIKLFKNNNYNCPTCRDKINFYEEYNINHQFKYFRNKFKHINFFIIE